jgi:hypothetical protein
MPWRAGEPADGGATDEINPQRGTSIVLRGRTVPGDRAHGSELGWLIYKGPPPVFLAGGDFRQAAESVSATCRSARYIDFAGFTGSQILLQAVTDLRPRAIDVAVARLESARARLIAGLGDDQVFRSAEDAVRGYRGRSQNSAFAGHRGRSPNRSRGACIRAGGRWTRPVRERRLDALSRVPRV